MNLSPPADRWNNRALARLLWPLVAEQILTVTMGIADTIMVSSVGEYTVSAVSVVDNINNLLIIASVALATGGTVVVSQYLGRLDTKNANLAARQLMYVTTGTGLVLTLIIVFTRTQILYLVYGNLTRDVMDSATVYFFLTALSYPFLAVYNSAAAIYRAMANSRVPMFIALLVNIMNIGGNAILIYGFHLGAAGAALSTLLSRVAAAFILTAMLMSGTKKPICLAGLFRIKLEPSLIRSILNVGIPSGLESSMFQFGRLLVTRIFTVFGTAAIAANAITSVINSICFMPGMAYCMALLTIVGQCVGAGNYPGARRYTIKIIKICYVSLTTLSMINFIFMEPIVSLFHLRPEAHEMAKSFLTVHCITLALCWPLSFAVPSALRAAGDARFCMGVAIISMWFVRVSAAYLLAYPLGLGPIGVWIAMGGDFILRSVCYTLRWRGNKWQTKRVIGE
jgi:putative MATE family efflux protein